MFKNVDRVHGRFLQYAIFNVVVGIFTAPNKHTRLSKADSDL